MIVQRSTSFAVLVAMWMFAGGVGITRAQSTIFNVPSTDIVERKKVYAEFGLFAHLESHKQGGFQAYVPRAVVGLYKNLEVGVNLSVTDSVISTVASIQPNLKWRFLSSEKSGTSLSCGAVGYVHLRDREANDSSTLLYVNGSKRFSGKFGPRVTAGAFRLAAMSADATGRTGVMLAYEQPVHGGTSFAVDWFSGRSGLGYLTPGLSFALPGPSVLNIGYSVGNHGRKNNCLLANYGVTF